MRYFVINGEESGRTCALDLEELLDSLDGVDYK